MNGQDDSQKPPATAGGNNTGTGNSGSAGSVQGGDPYILIDAEAVRYMRMIRQDMQALVQVGRERFGKIIDTMINLKGQWYSDVPMLARTAADAYGYAPQLFQGSPCNSAQLRSLEEEVRMMGEFVTFLAETTTKISGIYDAGRKTLCDWTYGITDQVLGLEKLPFVPAEQKALVDDVAPLVHKILDDRNAGKTATKNRNKKLKDAGTAKEAAVQAKLTAKKQENTVLRGGTVEAQQPAPPPKGGRRNPRTRRNGG